MQFIIQITLIFIFNRDFRVLASRYSLNKNDATWRIVYRMLFPVLKTVFRLLCGHAKPKKH